MSIRGAQINPDNKFLKLSLSHEHVEGIDEWTDPTRPTRLFYESPKSILSKNNSVDIPFTYSINPYQGCEHGCIYCYARNSHEYYGFSAGLDFESNIMVKKNAAELLERAFLQPAWKPQTIVLSGNTDCYQPTEHKLKITRQLLGMMLKYRNPVGIITKNALIQRDIDILEELASLNLVHVYVSITTLEEDTRRKLEPRTATANRRLETIAKLTEKGIPTGVMVAPIIPWINHTEIPEILNRAASAGALTAAYTLVRLNGTVAQVFMDWLAKAYPDRAERVINAIKEFHGGDVQDTKPGRRMRGAGTLADIIKQLFDQHKKKYLGGRGMPEYDTSKFRKRGNYGLFE